MEIVASWFRGFLHNQRRALTRKSKVGGCLLLASNKRTHGPLQCQEGTRTSALFGRSKGVLQLISPKYRDNLFSYEKKRKEEKELRLLRSTYCRFMFFNWTGIQPLKWLFATFLRNKC